MPENVTATDSRKQWSLHWMIGPLLLVAVVLFLRKPSYFFHPQFWAEDATVLFLEARQYGWHSFFLLHPGYYILAPRFVACAAAHLPALFVPWIYSYAALFFTLLTAWFCLRARLDDLMDRRGRMALALALVLTPSDGEILFALIGSQWLLMPILFVLIVQAQPLRRGQAAFDFLGLLVAGLTGPYIVLFAPWFLVRLRRAAGGWSRYNLLLIAIAWVLAGIQFWQLRKAGVPSPDDFGQPIEWLKGVGFVFPGSLFFGSAPRYLGRAFYVIDPLLLALLGWTLWRGQVNRRWAALCLLGCGGVAYAGAVREVLPSILSLDPFIEGSRYFYPFYLSTMWTAVIYCYDASARLRTASQVALAMVLMSTASHFVVPPADNLDWQAYTERLDAGKAVEGIQILPGWSVDFPARN